MEVATAVLTSVATLGAEKLVSLIFQLIDSLKSLKKKKTTTTTPSSTNEVSDVINTVLQPLCEEINGYIKIINHQLFSMSRVNSNGFTKQMEALRKELEGFEAQVNEWISSRSSISMVQAKNLSDRVAGSFRKHVLEALFMLSNQLQGKSTSERPNTVVNINIEQLHLHVDGVGSHELPFRLPNLIENLVNKNASIYNLPAAGARRSGTIRPRVDRPVPLLTYGKEKQVWRRVDGSKKIANTASQAQGSKLRPAANNVRWIQRPGFNIPAAKIVDLDDSINGSPAQSSRNRAPQTAVRQNAITNHSFSSNYTTQHPPAEASGSLQRYVKNMKRMRLDRDGCSFSDLLRLESEQQRSGSGGHNYVISYIYKSGEAAALMGDKGIFNGLRATAAAAASNNVSEKAAAIVFYMEVQLMHDQATIGASSGLAGVGIGLVAAPEYFRGEKFPGWYPKSCGLDGRIGTVNSNTAMKIQDLEVLQRKGDKAGLGVRLLRGHVPELFFTRNGKELQQKLELPKSNRESWITKDVRPVVAVRSENGSAKIRLSLHTL